MAIPQDDATWETNPESRYHQILRERDQLAGRANQLAGRVNQLERVIGEKDQQMESGFASSLLSSPTMSVSERRKFSNEKDDRQMDGITCKLCYITTSDNDFMEKHLMGESHIRNMEKESKKNQEEKEKHFMGESSPINMEAELKYQEEKKINEEFSVEKIKEMHKTDNHVEKTNINNAIEKQNDGELFIKANKAKESLDGNDGESINEMTKIITDVNPETEKSNKVTKAVADINPETEITKEENGDDCDFCNYFRRDDSRFHGQIPDHFCSGASFLMCSALPDLPAGWTEMRSRTTGQSYYRNNLTKKPQWERPTEPLYFLVETHVVEKKSQTTGCPYYVNKATKHRQWERPTESAEVEAAKDVSDLTSKIIEKLSEETPAKTKAGVMLSKLRKSNKAKREVTEIEHELKLWKQASALWNEQS